jgi:hypothetical protein
MYASRGELAKLNYMEINQLLDRKVIENKRGTLTNGEIKLLVQEIHDCQRESKLEHGTAEKEMEATKKKILCYNIEQLEVIPMEREDGTMRILVYQMGG